MKIIHKFHLSLEYKQSIVADFNWKVLDIQIQNEEIVLWAIVNPEGVKSEHIIACYGTGCETDRYALGKHLGTVQMEVYVWHFFEQDH